MAGEMRSRAEQRRRYDPLDPACQHRPRQAADMVRSLVTGSLERGMGQTGRAFAVWSRVCGTRALRHTVAVWVRDDPAGGMPDLYVYLDGNTLMADLATNADLYVERLAYAGMPVRRVCFRLSRYAGQRSRLSGGGAFGQGSRPAPRELPPLTPAERSFVERSCEELPDALRKSATEAMQLSLRWNKLKNTDNVSESRQTPR